MLSPLNQAPVSPPNSVSGAYRWTAECSQPSMNRTWPTCGGVGVGVGNGGVRVGVGVGVAAAALHGLLQPHRALLTACKSSLIATLELWSTSKLVHADSGALSSAMFTPTMISLTVTCASPLQSPTHDCALTEELLENVITPETSAVRTALRMRHIPSFPSVALTNRSPATAGLWSPNSKLAASRCCRQGTQPDVCCSGVTSNDDLPPGRYSPGVTGARTPALAAPPQERIRPWGQ
jgi:hypothetical protein